MSECDYLGANRLAKDVRERAGDTDGAGRRPAKLAVVNHPLPLTNRAATLLRLQLSAATALFLIVPLVLMTGNYAIFVVKERTSQALHVQQLTGLSPAVYWRARRLLNRRTTAAIKSYGKDAQKCS